ncbi:MAG TPA: methyltransferase domain-containing protein [Actinomycetes bacterium]
MGELDALDTVEPTVESRHRWLVELLGVEPGSRVVDLGCGTGSSLRFIAPRLLDGVAVGVDRAVPALREAAGVLAHAGRARLLRADLGRPLPFAGASFDRALCHNVLEFLPDPQLLLREAFRVLRPGGRLVLSHSDFDTLVFASEDVALTRRLVRAYSDTQQHWMDAVDGTMGRRLVEVVGRTAFAVVDVQAAVVLSRRFQPHELGYGYAYNIAGALRDAGVADAAELERWIAGLRRLDERGAFLFSLNDYAVVCSRPASV